MNRTEADQKQVCRADLQQGKSYKIKERFEVLGAVKMWVFLRVVTPCGLAGRYRRFTG
jgi:hypothetical protein